MFRFIKKNRALSICFCFSFSFCIFFILKLNSKEEFNYAYNWLNSLFQLSIGFIINFIFFITQIYIPQYRNDREANRCIGVRIDGIVNHMGELLSQLGTMYMGEYDEDKATSEYWLDVLRQINTNDRVGVLKSERLYSTSPNEESYFTVKEWIISSKFIKYSPKPLEKINEWTNGYFIYEFIDGVALKDFVDDYNLYSYSKNDITKNYFKFLTLLKIFEKLIELVGYFHQENIVLNDIHPDNIIITNMLELYFVDLENSYLSNESPLVGIYNDICLEKWNYIEGKKADCYKIANLILFLLGRLQLKGERDSKIDNIKELLLQKGIDTNIDILIKYLFSDEPDIFTSKKIFSNIYVRKNKEKKIDAWINTELLPLSNQEFFNLLESRVIFSVTTNTTSAEILTLFNNFRDFGFEFELVG